MAMTGIGSKARLAFGGTFPSPDSKDGVSPAESSCTGGTKNRRGRDANGASPDKMKQSFCVKLRSKCAVRHPVSKPVDLPEFQIGDDTRFAVWALRSSSGGKIHPFSGCLSRLCLGGAAGYFAPEGQPASRQALQSLWGAYGTILVDLETRRVVDRLPERAALPAAKWLAAHHLGPVANGPAAALHLLLLL